MNRQARRAAKKAAAAHPPASVQDLLQRGVTLQRAGNLGQAEAIYRQVLAAEPENPEAANLLGLICLQVGRPDDAVTLFNNATLLRPNVAVYQGNLALAHKARGAPEVAVAHLRHALRLKPDAPDLMNNLANALDMTGERQEALALLDDALALSPSFPEAENNRGAVLLALRRPDEAVAAFERAMALRPNYIEPAINCAAALIRLNQAAEAETLLRGLADRAPRHAKLWLNLGNALAEQGDSVGAVPAFQKAIDCDPRYAEAYANLANAYRQVGDFPLAEESLRKALKLKPKLSIAHAVLARVLEDQGRADEARDHFDQAIAHDPQSAEAYFHLANAVRETGNVTEAIALLKKAIDLDPLHTSSYNNLGIIHLDMSLQDEAAEFYRLGLEVDSHATSMHSNALMAMHYDPRLSRQQIFDAHREWNAIHAAPIAPLAEPFRNVRTTGRPLRVGFMSGSFRRHPVGYMTLAALEAVDPAELELVYYNTATDSDDFTGRFKATAKLWRSIAGQTDRDVARMIRRDRIDILVDLSGHSGRNRLLVLPCRAAPVQVKWVGGLFNTLGMDCVDYLLTDVNETPEGEEEWYTEKLYRMPHGYVSYLPPLKFSDVRPPPALATGRVTFGCLNNITKINAEIASVWARILNGLPDSRLILKSKWLRDETTRQVVIDRFAAVGVAADRLGLRPNSPHAELLDTYHEIDIALDPWPYSGGLTTCEAMWMGVPVISWPGPTFAGRHSVSHLRNVGLDDWVVDGPDAYVALALARAADLDGLAALRATLRDRLRTSPLCDGEGFARDLTVAFHEMWAGWCAEQKDALAAS